MIRSSVFIYTVVSVLLSNNILNWTREYVPLPLSCASLLIFVRACVRACACNILSVCLSNGIYLCVCFFIRYVSALPWCSGFLCCYPQLQILNQVCLLLVPRYTSEGHKVYSRWSLWCHSSISSKRDGAPSSPRTHRLPSHVARVMYYILHGTENGIECQGTKSYHTKRYGIRCRKIPPSLYCCE